MSGTGSRQDPGFRALTMRCGIEGVSLRDSGASRRRGFLAMTMTITHPPLPQSLAAAAPLLAVQPRTTPRSVAPLDSSASSVLRFPRAVTSKKALPQPEPEQRRLQEGKKSHAFVGRPALCLSANCKIVSSGSAKWPMPAVDRGGTGKTLAAPSANLDRGTNQGAGCRNITGASTFVCHQRAADGPASVTPAMYSVRPSHSNIFSGKKRPDPEVGATRHQCVHLYSA
jgi:hypothetical protein